MSNSETIHENEVTSSEEHCHHVKEFLALPTKRLRTASESERIITSPSFKGTIVSFCRDKGHGFVKPDNETEPLFVHICEVASFLSIEGEWCPKEGDIVSFKKALMPPKMQKYRAVHVQFIHLNEEVKHENWNNIRTIQN